jgi:hypothetical protein
MIARAVDQMFLRLAAPTRRPKASRAERFDINTQGMGNPNRIGDLYLTTLGKPGGDDILGYPPRCIRSTAIDLVASLPLNAPRRDAPCHHKYRQ